jgi:hypothetical protein
LEFLGRGLFGFENHRKRGLDFLGFPWILSSESRLINGLHRIFAEKFFRGPFAPGFRGGGTEEAPEAMEKRGIVHRASVCEILIFCNELSLWPFPKSHLDWRLGRLLTEGEHSVLSSPDGEAISP